MVRSRGRGGFLKPRSRRTVSQTAAKAPGEDSKHDQNSALAGNDTAVPAPDPTLNQAGDGGFSHCAMYKAAPLFSIYSGEFESG